MKRLGHVLVSLFLLCSPLLAQRVVKVEAISTDVSTFRESRIRLNMAELAAQLVPYQSSVDTTLFALLAGDTDGQVIQGRTGANAARVDIGETSIDEAKLIGGGATSGFIKADADGVFASSPDLGTSFDLYDGGVDIASDGSSSFYGATATNIGVAGGPTSINGSRVNIASFQTPPTNANDTCTAGDTIDTATFHYYCAATDTWVRVAMATW